MTPLWTPELRRDFHEAVETLHAINEVPSEERDYRPLLPDIPSTYHTLRLGDELQLADHVAYLAHSQEGVHAISAACVEESDNGLVIRLASNSTPSSQTVSGLRKILDTFSNGARRGKKWSVMVLTRMDSDSYSIFTGTPADVLEELLFEDVLDLSTDRILQRIRPPWIKSPAYYRGFEKPLWLRINTTLTQMTFSGDLTPYDDILSRLKKFTSTARDLEFRLEGAQLRETIKRIVRSCAEISYSGEHRSLEQQVALHGGSDFVTKEVLQIDKLARYFSLCRDLGKLSARCEFHNTTKGITLQHLASFQAERPKGASQTCYVHAEVQLILYYEQYSSEKPPRAIGCSKSACFLCDILIQKLRKYCISYSHKRLYNQWTIKNVCWMTPEQVFYFRDILQAIITEISALALDKTQLQFRKFGLESRAVLPLSSNSSLGGRPRKSMPPLSDSATPRKSASTITKSESTTVQENTAPRPQKEAAPANEFILMHPAATLSCLSLPSMRDLSKNDLPHHQEFGSKAETFLDLGKLLLIFDCSTVSTGSISIRMVEADSTRDDEDEIRRIRVADVPNTEMRVNSDGSSKMRFRLDTGHSEVEVEIVWN